jgi:hypothetical protein
MLPTGSLYRGTRPGGTCFHTNGRVPLMSGKITQNPAFLLQCFKFILMPWFPVQVVEAQYENTQSEGDQGQVFVSKIARKVLSIKPKEFAKHPIRVGADPDGYGKVMGQFRHVLPCSPGDDNGNDECGKDHGDAQGFPDHAPGHVFEKPEDDMEVFHFAVAEGDSISGFFTHAFKCKK